MCTYGTWHVAYPIDVTYCFPGFVSKSIYYVYHLIEFCFVIFLPNLRLVEKIGVEVEPQQDCFIEILTSRCASVFPMLARL